jgi:hypothetical protein
MYQQTRKQEETTASQSNIIERLSMILRTIPGQYVNVIMKPSIATFNKEQERASWLAVLVHSLLLIAIVAALNWIAMLLPFAAFHTIGTTISSRLWLIALLPPPLGSIVCTITIFLIGAGTGYLLSKLCKGQGTFVAHVYLLLLSTVPLVTIGGIALLFPAPGVLIYPLLGLSGVLFAYRLALHSMIIVAIHHLKTAVAILIALILPMLIALIGLIVLSEGRMLESLFDIDLFEAKRKSKTKHGGV